MGRVFTKIDEQVAGFIRRQEIFFVATAPSEGHLNLSPKGLDTFRILDERTVAYLDFVGSGIETVAHLRENGRIVVMFCAFDGAPNIVRIHGHGAVLEPACEDFAQLLPLFPAHPGVRSIIRIDCERVSESCGFGVPVYEFRGRREKLLDLAKSKGPSGLADYQRQKNAASIDGLPGLRAYAP